MSLLALRLLLAPALVVGASLAARRWGPAAAGVAAGIPIVAGPILLVVALDHGPRFGGGVARAALLGIAGSAAFAVAYGYAARRTGWPLAVLAGWASFAAVAVVVASVSAPAGLALPVTLAAVVLARRALPRPGAGVVEPRRPAWDLPLRALSAAALVVAVTGLAATLGERATGALAPFPVAASVLAAFTHAQYGASAALALLRSMLLYFTAFAAFCFALAVALPPLGTTAGFGVALAALALVAGAVAAASRRTAARAGS